MSLPHLFNDLHQYGPICIYFIFCIIILYNVIDCVAQIVPALAIRSSFS